MIAPDILLVPLKACCVDDAQTKKLSGWSVKIKKWNEQFKV